ncbi:MAG: hypothetical protein AVDCRST_MAG18-1517, partial [uncultured Thermomicrobiales bacterium]
GEVSHDRRRACLAHVALDR